MPVYVYETTDDAERRHFEVRQSMMDPVLTKDPETGRPVRRVISGGFGVMRKVRSGEVPAPAPTGGGGCSGGGCGCH